MNHTIPTALLDDFRKCIDELIDCNAFELQLHTDENGQTDCYIPYMMNDALECYFVLKDCKITGELLTGSLDSSDSSDAPGGSDDFGNFACDKRLSVGVIDDGNTQALVIRQTNGSVSTVWFQNLAKKLNCYRYHEIGHFWVAGQEQWRHLVYMIGTIYDKFSYMGKELCNDKELTLLPLMEFAPFRYWSPIHEPLDKYYPDTLDGFACFKVLCAESRDFSLLRLVEKYERVSCGTLWITDFYRKIALPRIVKKIAYEMNRVGHEALYELIYQKVCEASSKYPARDYSETMNAMIDKTRLEVTESLVKKGFDGEYPRFVKCVGNKDGIVSGRTRFTSVLVTEEHPFTLSALEYENYDFRIQLMVSETSNEVCYLNQGFFDGNHNKSQIVKSVDEL